MLSARRLFAEYNRRYWGGRLPQFHVRQRARIPGGLEGQCDKPRRTIWLRADLPAEALGRALLHEMCHAAERGKSGRHGKSFLQELRRLATAGEPWATEEAALYADPSSRIMGTRAAILARMKDLLLTESLPAWGAARRALALEFGLSLPDFDRRHRWARATWQRLEREERSTRAEETILRAQLRAAGLPID